MRCVEKPLGRRSCGRLWRRGYNVLHHQFVRPGETGAEQVLVSPRLQGELPAPSSPGAAASAQGLERQELMLRRAGLRRSSPWAAAGCFPTA